MNKKKQIKLHKKQFGYEGKGYGKSKKQAKESKDVKFTQAKIGGVVFKSGDLIEDGITTYEVVRFTNQRVILKEPDTDRVLTPKLKTKLENFWVC